MTDHPAIAFDDEATWPGNLLRLLDGRFTDLKAYEKENRRIDRLAEKDVLLRINRPENRYQANIVGFHCTRLHAEEIEHILNQGMLPSSEAWLVERIAQRGKAGDLPPHLLLRLLAEHQAADSNRSGMITGLR